MEGRRVLQRDLNRLNPWAKANRVMYNKAKCPVLPLGHNNSVQCHRLGCEWWGSCLVEKDQEVLVDS